MAKSLLVSYNDSQAVRDLFPGWDAAPLSWSYGMNAAKDSSELLLASFPSVIRALRPAGHHGSALTHHCDTRGARPALGSICSRCWRGS